MSKKPIKVMDTTFRDAHQSLLATRMRIEDLLPIAEKMDSVGFWSLEVWGGATFDTCIRFLREDPWERLRELKKHIRKTPLQMLLRGQNVVGYRHYADDVVEAFVAKMIENGINVVRIFDALNDFRNVKKSVKSTLKHGGKVEAAFCYTLGPIYTNDFFVELALKLEDMGADTICIKDMAGLLSPMDAFDLITKLKARIALPIHLHTHDTSGMSVATTLKAIEAGVDIVDTAISSMASGTSQPALETLCNVLSGSQYDPEFDFRTLDQINDHFKAVRKNYAHFESEFTGIDPKAVIYQVPGGMISNLANQLKEQNALHRMAEVMNEVPVVREDFGYPPLVTPSSQIVGTQATLNVLTGERYKVVTSETRNYLKGLYGKPPAPVNADVQQKVLGEEEIITTRPADLLEPEMPKAREELGEKAKSDEDVISYALFPKIFLEFAELREKGFPPEPQKEKPASAAPAECATHLAPSEFMINVHGEDFHVKVGGKGHKSEGKRPYFLYVDNTLVEVLVEPLVEVLPSEEGMIDPKKTSGSSKRPKAEAPGDITTAMPGSVVKMKVQQGDTVKEGDTVLIVEAMKMENEIHTPVAGTVEEIYVAEGDVVNPDEVLIRIR
ncbi:MAG TPA: sodium-extruding oxaloacetate decarboxylase subunit alpha [Dissulfurispiraceae bacterium]|nr:sodium-extruding oxaloacetate decarboxylase subunit alpha [Dissulfurispiraceae bacterium]